MSILSIRNLSKSFGGVHAVDKVSFDLNAGEFLAMIGPNGAGKSTCFNMINGQSEPDSGEILFMGQSISGLQPRSIWRLGVGRTFQIAATFGSMTVAENVQMALISHAGETYRAWRPAAAHHRQRALELLQQVGMEEAADRGCRVLAYGDVKRVELAIALANEPRLAADGRADRRHGAARAQCDDCAGQETRGRARDFGAVHRAFHGRGVRLCRPHPGAGARHADRDGTAESIRDNPEVQQVYLGTARPTPEPRDERAHARGQRAERVVRRSPHPVRSVVSHRAG